MTTFNKTTLKTFFEEGDNPSGTDYANLIDSQINVAETAIQNMAGPLSATKLIASRVSAGTLNVTGVFSAASFSINSLTVSSIASAGAINVAGDVSAASGTVYASALRTTSGIYRSVAIISAAGTTQATGTSIGLNGIIRAKGIVDGTTTGFLLTANQTGLQQTIWI